MKIPSKMPFKSVKKQVVTNEDCVFLVMNLTTGELINATKASVGIGVFSCPICQDLVVFEKMFNPSFKHNYRSYCTYGLQN